MTMKGQLARKAAKATAKHTAHGTASKIKRSPLRATTLLGMGALVGGVTGWLAGRSHAHTA